MSIHIVPQVITDTFPQHGLGPMVRYFAGREAFLAQDEIAGAHSHQAAAIVNTNAAVAADSGGPACPAMALAATAL